MSQENIDRLRRGYEAFARRDLDAALEMMDPEIEAHDAPEAPDAAVHHGGEAVRRDWEQMFALFEDFTIDIEEVFDASEELSSSCASAGVGGKAARGSTREWRTSGPSERGRRFGFGSTWTAPKPSQPPGSRSKTLTRSPDSERYRAGDVAGERGDRAGCLRRVRAGQLLGSGDL
jgi:hypothetical protein